VNPETTDPTIEEVQPDPGKKKRKKKKKEAKKKRKAKLKAAKKKKQREKERKKARKAKEKARKNKNKSSSRRSSPNPENTETTDQNETDATGETNTTSETNATETPREIPYTLSMDSTKMGIGYGAGTGSNGKDHGLTLDIINLDVMWTTDKLREEGQGWSLLAELSPAEDYQYIAHGKEIFGNKTYAAGGAYTITPFRNDDQLLSFGVQMRMNTFLDISRFMPQNEFQPLSLKVMFNDMKPLYDQGTYAMAQYSRGFGQIGHTEELEIKGRYCFEEIPQLSIEGRCRNVKYKFNDIKISDVSEVGATVNWTFQRQYNDPLELGLGAVYERANIQNQVFNSLLVQFKVSVRMSWNAEDDNSYNRRD
ncbi:hypothetical protein N9N67_08605, partial [Bacteriovoracaceae bacterium]|nr:hypothetical protein [Bacteriovoracaceae bacterium]